MTQSRRMLVLRAVVEDYIRSQEPVGSTSLTRDHDLGVSSATIRNDMAALEDEGYLIQPHTSAGRVPTEKGYRYFVDRLATVVPLSEAQRRGINSFLSGSVSLKDALQRSARLLSEITGQVAVVASPSLAKATLRHVEMVPVAMTTLLAVVITDTGRVAQHGLTIASMPAVDETNRLSNTVNEQCDGLSLSKSAETVRSIAASAGYESVRGVADALADAVVGGGDARQEVDFAVGVLGGEDHALAVFGRPRRVRGLVVAEVPEGHEPVSQRDRAHEENIGARETHAAALCGEQRGVRCAGRRGFSA